MSIKLTESELRDRRIARCREYRAKNLAALQAYDRMRFQRDKEKRMAISRKWAKDNPEKMRVAVRKSMAKNRHKYAETDLAWKSANTDKTRAYYKKYQAANRAKCNAATSRWAKNNPGHAAELAATRRFRIKNATPGWVDRTGLREFYIASAHISDISGIPHEVDHVYPLVHAKFSGLHVPWNLQILTASENSSKGNRLCL